MLKETAISRLIKGYAALALLVSVFLAPLNLSFMPMLLLTWYLFQWRWSFSPLVNLMTQYFTFFALGLLYVTAAGPIIAWLVALPLLYLVDAALVRAALSSPQQPGKRPRAITSNAVLVGGTALAALLIAIMLDSRVMLLSSLVFIDYLLIRFAIVLKNLTRRPIEVKPVQVRCIAGKEGKAEVILNVQTKAGGLLFLESPYDWLKVNPARASLKGDKISLRLTFTPPLSGPGLIKLKGYAVDRRGLCQVQFEINVLKLVVIPRARYAQWLADRYLAGTKPGALSLISNIGTLKPMYGLRSGLEYYGNRDYQPGDSLKNIDWKHTFKCDELIIKGFSDARAQSAIILINLVTGSEEQKDRLAYNILVTALSLARENIPAALAVYDAEKVLLATGKNDAQQLVLNALHIVREITSVPEPVRYLSVPDVSRLKTNLNRMSRSENSAIQALHGILQAEFQSLRRSATASPCADALSEVSVKAGGQATVVVISQGNNGAEALAFTTFLLKQKGTAVIAV